VRSAGMFATGRNYARFQSLPEYSAQRSCSRLLRNVAWPSGVPIATKEFAALFAPNACTNSR
jgi:hypothetical protein